MIAALVLLASLALLCSIGLPIALARRAVLAQRLRSRVIVTLKDGEAFDGVLFSADRTVWILRNAQAVGLGENGTNAPVDGEVLVLTADIAFAQKL